jgi:hypothetical protein
MNRLTTRAALAALLLLSPSTVGAQTHDAPAGRAASAAGRVRQ